jgi:L-malate glycosyltransferase
VRLTFVVPAAPHPIGGVAIMYEYAGAMARRGHSVHLVHVEFFSGAVTSVRDIEWFTFPDGVTHEFVAPGGFDARSLPPADVVIGYAPDWELQPHSGLPLILIQGYRMLNRELEHLAFRARCPKICVASWLVDIGRELGVPEAELVHVPLGLRHEKYRVLTPLDRRPMRISYCYNSHFSKRAPFALEVLSAVKQAVPDVEAVLFSSVPPEHEIPSWISFRTNPPQQELVGEIYNGSRIFICTSEVEGFGLPCIEAMACGATLVTTDNGGSHDYAFPGRTALVSEPGDLDTMVDHVISLLRDDEHRIALGEAGTRHVDAFDWGRSADLLEEFLERYVASPVAFGRPPVSA